MHTLTLYYWSMKLASRHENKARPVVISTKCHIFSSTVCAFLLNWRVKPVEFLPPPTSLLVLQSTSVSQISPSALVANAICLGYIQNNMCRTVQAAFVHSELTNYAEREIHTHNTQVECRCRMQRQGFVRVSFSAKVASVQDAGPTGCCSLLSVWGKEGWDFPQGRKEHWGPKRDSEFL